MSQPADGRAAPPYDPDHAVPARTPGWRIGTLRGTPVYLGRSWPILAAFVLVTWGPRYPELGATSYVVALVYALLLLLSVLAHEAAHALTAQAFGHRVHAIVADLMGGHTSYQTETNTPGRSALVALAGPAANAALAVLGWLALPAARASEVPWLLTAAFVVSNAFVAVFNLLPGLPLDGGFVLDALVWRVTGSRTTGLLVAGWTGRLVTVLAVLWLVGVPLLQGGGPDLVMIMWTALIGSFLWQGATVAIRSAQARRLVDALPWEPLAHPAALLAPSSTVADAVAAYERGAHACVALDDQGTPVAVVAPAAVQAVPAQRRALTPVTAVVTPQPRGWVLDLPTGTVLTSALERCAQVGSEVVLLRAADGRALLLDAGEIEHAAATAPRR